MAASPPIKLKNTYKKAKKYEPRFNNRTASVLNVDNVVKEPIAPVLIATFNCGFIFPLWLNFFVNMPKSSAPIIFVISVPMGNPTPQRNTEIDINKNLRRLPTIPPIPIKTYVNIISCLHYGL